MALEIVWTKRAITGYDKVVAHLEKHWTEKEVENFIRQSRDFFELLKEYPEMLEMTGSQKNLHRGPINKHTILTYRVKPRKEEIEFINIRFSKQNPLKK